LYNILFATQLQQLFLHFLFIFPLFDKPLFVVKYFCFRPAVFIVLLFYMIAL